MTSHPIEKCTGDLRFIRALCYLQYGRLKDLILNEVLDNKDNLRQMIRYLKQGSPPSNYHISLNDEVYELIKQLIENDMFE